MGSGRRVGCVRARQWSDRRSRCRGMVRLGCGRDGVDPGSVDLRDDGSPGSVVAPTGRGDRRRAIGAGAAGPGTGGAVSGAVESHRRLRRERSRPGVGRRCDREGVTVPVHAARRRRGRLRVGEGRHAESRARRRIPRRPRRHRAHCGTGRRAPRAAVDGDGRTARQRRHGTGALRVRSRGRRPGPTLVGAARRRRLPARSDDRPLVVRPTPGLPALHGCRR